MTAILVVDDEERIRRIYGRMFEKEGFEVFEAPDAASAYEIFVESRPKIVLLDINMADVDGTVFYDVVQALGSGAQVIVTSVLSVERQKQCIKGAAGYYDKSDSIRILLEKVRAVLGNATQLERR